MYVSLKFECLTIVGRSNPKTLLYLIALSPNEWIGSMVVFSTVLGIARVKTWAKVSILFGLIYWCHFNARWESATFLSGILLAELSFQRPKYIKHPLMRDHLAPRIFWTFLFLFGIYVGSHPQLEPEIAPGYRTLMSYTPSWYKNDKEHPATNPRTVFWLAFGGPLIIFALEHAKFLQDMFTTRFAQYLGEISFSLYMLHFQIMCTMGHWLVPKCMDLTGGWANGQFGFVSAMALAIVILLPVTFWASDVFSRLVDAKCVRFAKWVSEKTFTS
jgi:peptidoglycan/LPS O-acetylase OafA/YrhL